MVSRKCLLAVTAVIAVKKKREKNRTRWCKNWLLRRKTFSHINLLKELILEPGDWYNYLRMDEATYLELLQLVTPLILKQNTDLREAISPHERLTATLRFIATGRSYEDLKFSVVISPQALGQIIIETCAAIYSVLRKEYLRAYEACADCNEQHTHCVPGPYHPVRTFIKSNRNRFCTTVKPCRFFLHTLHFWYVRTSPYGPIRANCT